MKNKKLAMRYAVFIPLTLSVLTLCIGCSGVSLKLSLEQNTKQSQLALQQLDAENSKKDSSSILFQSVFNANDPGVIELYLILPKALQEQYALKFQSSLFLVDQKSNLYPIHPDYLKKNATDEGLKLEFKNPSNTTLPFVKIPNPMQIKGLIVHVMNRNIIEKVKNEGTTLRFTNPNPMADIKQKSVFMAYYLPLLPINENKQEYPLIIDMENVFSRPIELSTTARDFSYLKALIP